MTEFKPRLTKPEKGNVYYNTVSNGGLSPAIKGCGCPVDTSAQQKHRPNRQVRQPTDPDCDVLSNCVGYALGRFNP